MAGEARPSFEFRPGVIVDPNRRLVYAMRPEKGVQAIDVVTGKVVWTSEAGDKPLGVLRGRLVVQADTPDRSAALRIVILEAGDGTMRSQAEAMLPAEVRPAIDETPTSSFATRGWQRAGKVFVSWAFSRRVPSGVDTGMSATQLHGVVAVDVATGRVETREREAHDETVPFSAPVRHAMAAGKIPRAPWRTGTLLTATVRAHDGGNRTVLERWRADTGEVLPDVVLFRDEDRWSVRYPSADGVHLLVSRPTGNADGSYTWRFFSLETGSHIADVTGSGPGARFFIADATLVHDVRRSGRLVGARFIGEQPLSLRGVRLADGSEVWSQRLRDTTLPTDQQYPPTTGQPTGVDSPR
ncbi:MAG: hypothetical protein IT293_15270 [Deltaproteobacteria bacterium]|nr:hypothetical protein [Deltaproteobacteria bacterium]